MAKKTLTIKMKDVFCMECGDSCVMRGYRSDINGVVCWWCVVDVISHQGLKDVTEERNPRSSAEEHSPVLVVVPDI